MINRCGSGTTCCILDCITSVCTPHAVCTEPACAHTHARRHAHIHTQTYKGSETTLLKQSLLRLSRWNRKLGLKNKKSVLVTQPKWLSLAVTKNKVQQGERKKKKETTQINSNTQLLTQQHEWQLVSNVWLDCSPKNKKWLLSKGLSLKIKTFSQPAAHSETCTGWISPATTLRQHLQSSPLENTVMCHSGFWRVHRKGSERRPQSPRSLSHDLHCKTSAKPDT